MTEPDEGTDERATGTDDRAAPGAGTDEVGLDGLTSAASRVVSQAASILEEEMAAGIGAVKQVEHRLLDVDRLRDEDVTEVLQRFRRDAHDVVDILLDVAGAAVSSTTGIAQRAIRLRAAPDRPGPTPPPTPGVATLVVPGAVPPGATAEVSMSVDNDAAEPIDGFGFAVTDLMGPAGQRIPAGSVQLDPETLTLQPHGSARVTVRVDVPDGAARGAYSGLLQATRLGSVRAVLVVEVA